MKILFVCTGNICRSPTAHGVLAAKLKRASLERVHQVDSCGLSPHHVTEAPDPRTQAHAARRGYDLSKLRARQFQDSDFEIFDLIFAMDRGHLAQLKARCPSERLSKLALFLQNGDVPDPYYGDGTDFEMVLDLVEKQIEILLARLKS